MDRLIVYPGAIPLDTDILSVERNIMTAFGWLAQAALGTATGVAGLACTPTNPASMTVNIGPGAIWAQEVIDQNNFGSLPADASSLMKMGILPEAAGTNFTLTAPLVSGQSINYLIEAAFEEMDTDPVVLPYVNPSNPSQPYSGPANSGTPQNTVRAQIVDLQLKAGVAANTGTQLTPPVDAGYVGLYVITVNYGQTTIAVPNITAYPGAPFAVNITEAWLAQNFAALNGNATEVFNVATATQATHALSLGQAENEFAALAGNAAQAFAVAPATATTQAPQLQQVETLIASATANLGTMSEQNASDVTITGGTAALSSVTLAQPASAATQAPQLQQVQAIIESAIGAASGGVKVFKQNDTYTVPEGVTSVEVVVIGGGGGGMAPRIYISTIEVSIVLNIDFNPSNYSCGTKNYNNWIGSQSSANLYLQYSIPEINGTYILNTSLPMSVANAPANTGSGFLGGVEYDGSIVPFSNYDFQVTGFPVENDSASLTITPNLPTIQNQVGPVLNQIQYFFFPGGGGAGGGFAYVPSISVTSGQQIPITVGSSGSGEQPWILSNPNSVAPYYNTEITSYASPPTAGGTSSFGTIVTATGGTSGNYDGIAVPTTMQTSEFNNNINLTGTNDNLFTVFPDVSTGGTAVGPTNGIYLLGGAGAVGNLWNFPYFSSFLFMKQGPVNENEIEFFGINTPAAPGGGGGGAGNGGNFGHSNYGGIANNLSSQPAKAGGIPPQSLPEYVPSGGAGGNGGFLSNGANGQFPGGGGGGGSVISGLLGFQSQIPAENCFLGFSGDNGTTYFSYGGAVTGGGNGAPGVVIVIEHSGS